jgi:hypothetical protein
VAVCLFFKKEASLVFCEGEGGAEGLTANAAMANTAAMTKRAFIVRFFFFATFACTFDTQRKRSQAVEKRSARVRRAGEGLCGRPVMQKLIATLEVFKMMTAYHPAAPSKTPLC